MQFPLNVSFRLLLMCHQMLIFSTGETTIVDMRNDVILREHLSLTKAPCMEHKKLLGTFSLLVALCSSKSVAFDLVEWSNMLYVTTSSTTRESFSRVETRIREKGKRLLVTKDRRLFGNIAEKPCGLFHLHTLMGGSRHAWICLQGDNNSEARL